MRHETTVQSTAGGYLGRCLTCLDRDTEFRGYGEAQAWTDKHESDARALRLNTGAKRPSPKTVERVYREKSQTPTYSREERKMWLALADELREEIDKQDGRKRPIEGQMELFE